VAEKVGARDWVEDWNCRTAIRVHGVAVAVEARAARGKERRYMLLDSVKVRLKHARSRRFDSLPKPGAPGPLS